MYLEERVEQLENLSVDQGRQLESIANGLANLTVDVRAVRQDQNEGFARVDKEFGAINTRLDGHDKQFEELRASLNDLHTSLNEVKTTLQLVVKLLTER